MLDIRRQNSRLVIHDEHDCSLERHDGEGLEARIEYKSAHALSFRRDLHGLQVFDVCAREANKVSVNKKSTAESAVLHVADTAWQAYPLLRRMKKRARSSTVWMLRSLDIRYSLRRSRFERTLKVIPRGGKGARVARRNATELLPALHVDIDVLRDLDRKLKRLRRIVHLH